MAPNNTTEKKNDSHSSPANAVATPLFTGLNPQLQIAIDLLRKEGDRWEKSYNEERTRRKKVEEELLKLKEESMKKEHAVALQGIEDKKPDFLDRILNGIGNMPESIVQQIAPLIGRLGNALVPPGGTGQMTGVEGQLDEAQMQFIAWINGLPPESQKSFMMAMAELSRYDEVKFNTAVNQINAFLKSGTTIQRPQQTQYPDMSMYGN